MGRRDLGYFSYGDVKSSNIQMNIRNIVAEKQKGI